MSSAATHRSRASFFRFRYLVRCGNCRTLVLNSDPKCAHCGVSQRDTQLFSAAFIALTLAIAAGGIWLAVSSTVQPAADEGTERLVILNQERALHP